MSITLSAMLGAANVTAVNCNCTCCNGLKAIASQVICIRVISQIIQIIDISPVMHHAVV